MPLLEFEEELASANIKKHRACLESWTEVWGRTEEDRRTPEGAKRWKSSWRAHKIRSTSWCSQVSSPKSQYLHGCCSVFLFYYFIYLLWFICFYQSQSISLLNTAFFCTRKKDDRLDWMYQGPGGQISRDEYLLGRPVDKQILEQYEEPETGPCAQTGLLPGSIFNPNTPASNLDMAAKIREDPLFEIRSVEFYISESSGALFITVFLALQKFSWMHTVIRPLVLFLDLGCEDVALRIIRSVKIIRENELCIM